LEARKPTKLQIWEKVILLELVIQRRYRLSDNDKYVDIHVIGHDALI